MPKNRLKQVVKKMLKLADVRINGKRPWDIQVKDERLYKRVLSQGSLGLGEAYMDGWWEVEKLDEFFYRVLDAGLEKRIEFNLAVLFYYLQAKFFNLQSASKAFRVGKVHYDKGNDLYQAMLDKRMVYTCGYWQNAGNLEEAQKAKLDLVCRKIGLEKGQRVLDIGGGWGSFAKFAAEKYGVKVVAITVSEEQVKLGQKLCQGLPVEIRLQDYREVNEKFDHIVSLGMFEHVGVKNYRRYMEIVHKNLKNDGLFLLHTIGSDKSERVTNPWANKYIFPGGMLPSIKQIGKSIENFFVMEDWHNFSADYDKTLMTWFENFNSHWNELKNNYDERFYRMWKYYLLSCAGLFRARKAQLWQVVLSKHGVPGGYKSIR